MDRFNRKHPMGSEICVISRSGVAKNMPVRQRWIHMSECLTVSAYPSWRLCDFIKMRRFKEERTARAICLSENKLQNSFANYFMTLDRRLNYRGK